MSGYMKHTQYQVTEWQIVQNRQSQYNVHINNLGSQVLLGGGRVHKEKPSAGTLHFNHLKKIPLKNVQADMAV